MTDKPMYINIATDIKNNIKLGKYKSNALLPLVHEFCTKYGVSRVTVQNALSLLAAENLIYSIPGKGTFVNEVPANEFVFNFEELREFNNGESYIVKLLGVDIINPSPEIMIKLRIEDESSRVVNVKRLLFDKEKPAIYDTKFIPYYSGMPVIEAEIGYFVFPELVSNVVSLYEINRQITVSALLANTEICSILKIAQNEPVVIVEQKMLNEDNIPVGWGKLYYNYQYFSFNAKKINDQGL